jgi:hypothetical protein
MLFFIMDVAVAAIFIYFVIDAVRSYMGTTGTTWERLLAVGKQSATILWARFTVVVTAGTGGLAWVADVLNAPQVSSAITTYMSPRVVAVLMIGAALIAEIARRRTL